MDDPEPDETDTAALDDWGDAWRRSKYPDFSALAEGPSAGPGGGHGGEDSPLPSRHEEHGNDLFMAVKEYSSGPDDVDRLREFTSDSAADAFRRIVVGILGSIPADTYEIVITSDRSGLSRLMRSSLSTGYAMRNAEFRMLLNESMASSSTVGAGQSSTFPDNGEGNSASVHDLFTAEPDYVRNVASKGTVDASTLDGTVRWWDRERQVKLEMSGSDYVSKLEAENELLRERLAAAQLHDATNNKLMHFMRTLNPEKIASLQANLSNDALDSFKRTIKSVLGNLSSDKVQMTYSTGRDYLAQVTFWCLLVGYCVRNVEKRMEMNRAFQESNGFSGSSLRDGEKHGI